MELGSVVWFSSRPHPFVVQAIPCLELDCSCRDMWLRLTEVNLQGRALREPLSFELRVDLRHFVEREPPQRSADVEALAREFLVRFPTERIEALVEQWLEQRRIKRRLATYDAEGPRDQLLCFSEVIHNAGGISQSGRHYSYFFAHDGREFLLEDHYCPNPECDCREVSIEFWERTEQLQPKHRVDVEQLLMATFTLSGQLREISFSKQSTRSAKRLLTTWRNQCDYQFDEYRRRYEQIKAIGKRSFATRSPKTNRVDAPDPSRQRGVATVSSPRPQAGRNDPCPCGSGRKFKRCCARRNVS